MKGTLADFCERPAAPMLEQKVEETGLPISADGIQQRQAIDEWEQVRNSRVVLKHVDM
jgi:hypothetical protein